MGNLDIKAFALKFNRLTLRERVITFAALFICTLSITYFWILDPANIQFIKAEKSLKVTSTQQSSMKSEIEKVKLKLRDDPLKTINNEIIALGQTSVSLDTQLNLRLVKFIHANKMPVALTKVLAKSPGIKVNYLKSLPVESFSNDSDANTEDKKVLFYKHTLEMELTGNYNAMYHYLRNLEALQDKFYWSSLKYEVTDYPLASVTLQIYTLSDQQDLVSG